MAGDLTELEREVLTMVAYGETTRDVARALDISPHDVKSILERVFTKLGADDRGNPPPDQAA